MPDPDHNPPRQPDASDNRGLTHVDEHGRVKMVDVGSKPLTKRTAIAEGYFHAPAHVLDQILAGKLPKGEALATARIAGILAAKQCDTLIPLCHTLPLDQVTVDFDRTGEDRLRITAAASLTARTGVEMEALTAVSITALTLWDMTKAVSTDLRISEITLLEKRKEEL